MTKTITHDNLNALKKLVMCLEHDIVEGVSMKIDHDEDTDQYTVKLVYKGYKPSSFKK